MDKLNMRIIHTHDKEINWEKSSDFVPKAGELIVYDIDDKFNYERFKIGDGVTTVKDLPFTIDNVIKNMFSIENNVIYSDAGRITEYEESTT